MCVLFGEKREGTMDWNHYKLKWMKGTLEFMRVMNGLKEAGSKE
jgi:hypothetical protein